MTDPGFLRIVRAAIAAKQVPKKSLARKCKVSRPQFSEMIHGDREMPIEVQERLIAELGIKKARQRLESLSRLLIEQKPFDLQREKACGQFKED